MKRFVGVAVLFVLMIFAGMNASAQNVKFAHINSDELIQALPEFDSARVQLDNYQKELYNALELMSVEMNNASEKYQKESKTYTEVVRQNKEQELIDMNRRIQEFQTNAQTQLQEKQNTLFQPIYAKVDKAIKDVGKENGFIYVFDVARGSLLYFDETKSTNIMALAKTKLGIK
ncbi:MAG TPA: OmpH family outer membrane protein [Bacteroidales bacterium]|nr:OmpH family outer membrane protein [Bacteroidales bacterium]